MAHKTVTKRELCDRIAAATGCTQVTTKAVVRQFLDEITSALGKGSRIELRDFGVFGTRMRRANKARNPRTSERVDVPARAVVYFRVGNKMAEKAQDALSGLLKGHGSQD